MVGNEAKGTYETTSLQKFTKRKCKHVSFLVNFFSYTFCLKKYTSNRCVELNTQYWIKQSMTSLESLGCLYLNTKMSHNMLENSYISHFLTTYLIVIVVIYIFLGAINLIKKNTYMIHFKIVRISRNVYTYFI